MKKIKEICLRIDQYLFHSSSRMRSVILTVTMLSLFFICYLLVDKVHYAIASGHNFIFMPHKYFFIFFCIAALPIFGFLFFKLNIWMNFWGKTEKPKLIDFLFFGAIFLFLYFSFNHGDIAYTSIHGKSLLDIVFRGQNILDFYDYNQGTAVYLLPQYIIFGIWSIPVKLAYILAGIPPLDVNEFYRISGLTLWWYKLLPTLFYIGSAFMVYKIATLLNLDKNKAKWAAFLFLIFPMASFSQFIFGQYDSVGIFFELLMVSFFLQKKLMKASLMCMIAVTFKMFPIFVFVPLLLLFEKKIFKIIGYTIVALFGYLFFNLLFSGSEAFKISGEFKESMFSRFFAVGIGTTFGTISFFVMAVIAACIFAYFTDTANKDEFTWRKYALYIPLLVYSVFFMFVLYHPQWILILVPYLVLSIFINKNTNGLMLVSMGVNAGYLLTVFSFFWDQNVDANLVNSGIFPMIFGFTNGGTEFKSLHRFFNLGIHANPYITIFASLLIVNLILAFPSNKNILASKEIIREPLTVSRDMVWIQGMIILLFAVPACLLFFTQG